MAICVKSLSAMNGRLMFEPQWNHSTLRDLSHPIPEKPNDFLPSPKEKGSNTSRSSGGITWTLVKFFFKWFPVVFYIHLLYFLVYCVLFTDDNAISFFAIVTLCTQLLLLIPYCLGTRWYESCKSRSRRSKN
ncbi:hypothetical protein OTU49_010743 [Cherax quadricarinatus]|uniref:Uncharacterized protein n=1 Tax=Cherax quadricarinatus TaxID=27406 RepID=A0AAW0W737_CHEQU